MRVLVTGGGGFLGRYIVRRLCDRGDAVTILARRKQSFPGMRTESVRADIRDRDKVIQAVKGMDAVFHTAALAGIWGNYSEYFGVNVEGTRNVIEACLENSVKKLVFTSSPSVVFHNEDQEYIDETCPYPEKYLCPYPETKALAEKMVLEANGKNGLSTVSLRPHLIWGIGDPHLVPRILARSARGRLIRVGEGTNRVDMTHVENAAHAHILACDRLYAGSPIAGKCYFITDDRPVNLWEWINHLLISLGQSGVNRSISFPLAWRIGIMLEGIYGLSRIRSEPPMTRFVATQLAKSHYYDISRARADLGYQPVKDPQEGLRELVNYLLAHPED